MTRQTHRQAFTDPNKRTYVFADFATFTMHDREREKERKINK